MPLLTPEEIAALPWRKAEASGADNCVELARREGDVAIRSSKDPNGPVLLCPVEGLAALIAGIKRGEFDDLSQS